MADEATLAAILKQGGIGSDAMMPVAAVQRDPVLERQIQRRAMAGLPPTPDMAAYLKVMEPEKEARGEALSSIAPDAAMLLAGGPIARGVGAAVQHAPRLSAALLGGAGLTAGSAEAGPAKQAEADPRVSELSRLEAQIAAEKAKLEKQATTNFQSKTARDNAAAPILQGITQMQDRAKEIQATLDREMQEASLSNKPFAERHPNVALGLTVGGPIASGVLAGGVIGGINKYGGRIAAAADEARKAMNMPEFAKQAMRAENWSQWAPWAKRAAFAESAAIPAELRASTDFIDKKTLPPTSKAQQDAEAKLSAGNLPNYVAGMGMDALSGLIGAGSGAGISSLVSRSPKVDINTMSSYLRGLDTKKLSPDEIATALRARAEAAQGLPKSPIPLGTEPSQPSLSAQLRAQDPAPALSGPSGTQQSRRALPSQGKAPSANQSDRPEWASDPPENVKLDKGYHWDASVGRQRHESGGFGPTPKYSAPRVKKEGATTAKDEQSSVQVDDMKPLRYDD